VAGPGNALFIGKAQCATCQVPPLYTEPGYGIHTPAEIGIDSFQADRSPTHGYPTSPLAGLWFATLDDVVNHYDAFLGLGLSSTEKRDLVQFLPGNCRPSHRRCAYGSKRKGREDQPRRLRTGSSLLHH
jgi:hypothetical protein